MTATVAFTVAPAATFRPPGILLRTLRLDRWLCATCHRDNLVRRGSSIAQRPCRWCDTELDSGAFPVVPGQTYRFECYVKVRDGGWQYVTEEFTLTRKAG